MINKSKLAAWVIQQTTSSTPAGGGFRKLFSNVSKPFVPISNTTTSGNLGYIYRPMSFTKLLQNTTRVSADLVSGKFCQLIVFFSIPVELGD